MIVESCILRAMRNSGKGHAAYLIVLGAQVRGRKITDSLLRRLDAAIPYLLQYVETTVIVSGGQGPGEDITEAEAMAEYLEKQRDFQRADHKRRKIYIYKGKSALQPAVSKIAGRICLYRHK